MRKEAELRIENDRLVHENAELKRKLQETPTTVEMTETIKRLRLECDDKTRVIADLSAKAEVRRARGSRDEWQVTLRKLLTQMAASTSRYHAAHRSVQGLALRVAELQMRGERKTSDVQCDFGDLPAPVEREKERLMRALNTEVDESAIARPQYRVQYDRPEPTTVDEDSNYLSEVRLDPYLAESLRCTGFENVDDLVKMLLDKHIQPTPCSSPYASPARR